jgi:hypothetical protein
MLGYMAFAALTLLLVHSGFGRHMSSPVDLLVGAPIPFGFGLFAIQNGWINARYAKVNRDGSPVSFWFYVALLLAISAGMFLWGLVDAFRSWF